MIKSARPQLLIVIVLFFLGFGFSQGKADLIDGVPLHLFSDVSYLYDNSNANSFFRINDLDFFIAKPLDSHVNALAEIAFQPSFHDVTIDIERLYLQYVFSSWLKVSAGRFHTATGYWNDTYHHGGYLQTSVTRPVMDRFEDFGGILPTHTTGVEIRGNGPIGTGNLGYIFDIGNGRGPVKDPPAFFFSYSKSKSVGAVTYYELENGLRVGVDVYRSDLPGGPPADDDGTPLIVSGTPVLGPTGNEWIYGAHLVYNSSRIEWLTEYNHMTHFYTGSSTNLDGSGNTELNLLYSQLGYHIDLFTPFVRYEINDTNHPDAYLNTSPGYQAQGLLSTTRYFVGGTRYELSSSSALKLEITYISSGNPISQQNFINTNQVSSDWLANLNWSAAW